MEPKKVLDVSVQYSNLAKIFHWGFVVLFAYGISKQVDDISQLENFALLRFELIFAVTMILLLAIRFLYMTKKQSSSLPAETPVFQKLAAKLVHLGMYLSLATIAVSGILIGTYLLPPNLRPLIFSSFYPLREVCQARIDRLGKTPSRLE